MTTHSYVAFFLIYIFLGCQNVHATQVVVAPQHSITRPATAEMKTRGNLRGVIRDILNRKKLVPEVIEEQYIPPVEFYLDPPKIPSWDESRLA